MENKDKLREQFIIDFENKHGGNWLSGVPDLVLFLREYHEKIQESEIKPLKEELLNVHEDYNKLDKDYKYWQRKINDTDTQIEEQNHQIDEVNDIINWIKDVVKPSESGMGYDSPKDFEEKLMFKIEKMI